MPLCKHYSTLGRKANGTNMRRTANSSSSSSSPPEQELLRKEVDTGKAGLEVDTPVTCQRSLVAPSHLPPLQSNVIHIPRKTQQRAQHETLRESSSVHTPEWASHSNQERKSYGPFEVREETEDCPEGNTALNTGTPRTILPFFRSYDCKRYESCLELAAALNWESFTCSGCIGETNQHLVWKANLAKRQDRIAACLCKKNKISLV